MNNLFQIIILLLFFVPTTFSQIEFGEQIDISQSASGYLELKHFDLDNDGYDDLLCSADKNDRVCWFRNLGNGEFGEQRLIIDQINYAPKSVHAGDIDNDGDLDVVFSSSNFNDVRWAENLGGGVFSVPVAITSFLDEPESVFMGDLNGDGNIDVLVADRALDKIVWLENQGNGTFASSQNTITTSTNAAEDVYCADLDNDGDLDVVSASQLDDKIAWYENLGAGIFGPQQILSTNADYAFVVIAKDLDNDGNIDVVASSRNDNKIMWFKNLGGGVFSGENLISNSAFEVHDLNIADVNNDGLLDILSAAYADNKTAWYENLGAGLFSNEHVISTSTIGVTSANLFDADLDGDTDVFTASRLTTKIERFENLGTGLFGAAEDVLASAANPDRIETIDIDNDGDQDLFCFIEGNIYSNYAYAGTVWYENLGNGEFSKLTQITLDSAAAQIFSDLDGDNLSDILSISAGTGILRWRKNLGSGTFSPQQIISNAVQGGRSVFSIDLDQDGDIDVLSASANNDKIAWYENLGAGVFGPEQVVSLVAEGANFVHSFDFDGDGDLDIFSISAYDNEFVWYENNGNQSFGSEQVLYSSASGTDYEMTDINNDGLPDLVFMSSTSVRYYKNLGNLTFAAPALLVPSGSSLSKFDLMDIDFDGDIDVFVAKSGSNTTSWYENLGNLVYGPAQPLIGLTEDPRDVFLSDLDNDGDFDVVSASEDDDKIAWYQNKLYSNTYVSGRLFLDVNNNQIQDSNETGAFNANVFSVPQGDYTYTSSVGDYVMNFSNTPGAYQLQPQNFAYWSISTDSLLYNVVIDSTFSIQDSLDFGFKPDTVITELEADITGSFPRCNWTVNYWLSINNVGTTIPSGVYHLKLDDSVTYVNSAITPDSIIGQNIYWSYDSLNYFGNDQINLQVQMPDVNSLGYTMHDTLNVYYVDTLGALQLSVTDVLSQNLICAYDPNDKTASPLGLDSMGYISPLPNEIEYTIRFQNTGNDTAFVVVLTDQLDANLVWNSLNPVAASHAYQTSVDQNGLVTFTFGNILLPDSMVNEIGSHGFITYRIDVKPNLAVGTSIRNTANIYFDQNPAIITNTKIHTLFECEDVNFTISQTSCENDSLFGIVQETILTSTTYWEIPGVYTSTGSNFSWLADTSGNFNLTITMNNQLCLKDTIVPISIQPTQQVSLGIQDVCEGDSVLVFGNYETIPGIYTNIQQSATGCDSTLSIEVNVIPAQQVSLGVEDVCLGDSVFVFGSYETTPGIYTNILQSAAGCDSTVSIEVNVLPIPTVSLSSFNVDTVCIYSGLQTLPTGTPMNGTYAISGLTGNSFDPTIAGPGEHTLYYSIIDANNCTGEDSVTIFVDQCAGIYDMSNPYGITVHPNPFSNSTKITFEKEIHGEYEMIMTNAIGEVVLKRSELSGTSIAIKRGNLSSGIYLLTIVQADIGILGSFRVVIE